MNELRTPSDAVVCDYLEKFHGDWIIQGTDDALELLFGRFPKNDRLEEVLLKVVTLTTLYGAGLRFIDIHAVARHICRSEIDDGLDRGDLDLVHRIANPLEDEEFWRYYSFATKYCSFHRPRTFAIYDQYVERLLWEYAEKNRFSVFRRN